MLKKIKPRLTEILPTSMFVKKSSAKSSLSDSVLFVHIAKTAGTSFKKSIANFESVLCDYGPLSVETSAPIQNTVYRQADIFSFKRQFDQNNSWLIGHFNLARYINFVDSSRVITFVRHPLSQVVSHYNHYKKNHGYHQELEDFIVTPSFKNLQSNMLDGIPVGLIGNIGITENFHQSLELINTDLNIDLIEYRSNINKNKTVEEKSLSKAHTELILKHNAKDMILYHRALSIHNQRVQHRQLGKPWVYSHTALSPYDHNLIVGAAYTTTQEPVTLCLLKNNQVIDTQIANRLYQQQPRVKFHREGYIGFQFNIPKNSHEDDRFDVIAQQTQQKLNFEPFYKMTK
ncbi:sulfotransferase family 2 domain-containing protein [Shewanella youngdeokensis]|uniref:Sulfotransferase family 2 domain-containing protein n=1 Tax=Shewanella youngdeokensis TaxID=2999068 RepID=A0ABZ0K1N3_9GAMM|nr:sulfotransferase family 2 domain-containing protein [Shewanella sp. DAU334]